MTRQIIDIGQVGNDGTGDAIRDSFRKVNDNFQELYSSLGLGDRLTFSALGDTPTSYELQRRKIVTVNDVPDGLTFRELIAGSGLQIDYDLIPGAIRISSTFSDIVNDTSPQLGGNLDASSGGTQYRIINLPGPIAGGDATNKNYVDGKLSLAGIDAVDPATGLGAPSWGYMTGPLILSRDPISQDDDDNDGLVAATKRYVDGTSFFSLVNLYVSKDGEDNRTDIADERKGRALAYAFASVERACKEAERIIEDAPFELGPYQKRLTFNSGASDCTLTSITSAPGGGVGAIATTRMEVDIAELNNPGLGYQIGDILTLIGGAGSATGSFQVLSVNPANGQIITVRRLSSGNYTALPGTTNIPTSSTSVVGTGASFDVTYKVKTVSLVNGGSGYGVVSVLITGGGGSGAFATATVDSITGAISAIILTDGGSGYTSVPSVSISLPRFLVNTATLGTDFSDDVREGLLLRGETSGALALILSHDGSLSGANEIFDVDVISGAFQVGEKLAYGEPVKNVQITILVESGIYFENYPIKVPANVSIKGDEFRRTIIRPRPGVSTSPWANIYFRRDRIIDGLTTATPYQHGYHYLTDATRPIYPLISNDGRFTNASTLLSLNKAFIQAEVIAFINQTYPSLVYDEDTCERDVGLIVDALVYDFIYGGYSRTIEAALKYYQNASGLIAITAPQKTATIAAITYINTIGQFIIANILLTSGTVPSKKSTATQIRNEALVSETGSNILLTDLVTAITDILDSTANFNSPKDNLEMDVFLMNDATILRNITVQGHGGFAMVLDPEGQILTKSPYAQVGTVISGSTGRQRFAGGLFIDGFAGNIQATPVSKSSDFLINVTGLKRRPQTPCSFIVDGVTYSVNYLRNFVSNIAGSSATLVLDSTTPYTNNIVALPSLSVTGGKNQAADLLDLNREFIQDEVTGWIDAQIAGSIAPFTALFRYNSDLCNRDVGFIVDAIVDDISGGTAAQTTNAAQAYWDSRSARIAITDQLAETTAAIDYALSLMLDVISNTTVVTTYSATPQVIDGTKVAESGSDTQITNLVNHLKTIIAYTTAARIELITAGNRSMLSNDFTQINDMGYGILATNGGLTEAVGMFTYYCYTAFYSLNGAQIRSVGGSSANGVYALKAEGSDPLEVPDEVELLYNISQSGEIYAVGSYANAKAGLIVNVTNFEYPPINGCEIEINHNSADFDAVTDVNTTDDEITIEGHPFQDDDEVIYSNGGGTDIVGAGIVNGGTLYIIRIDANTVQVSSTLGGSAIDITGAGVGTSHKFTLANGGNLSRYLVANVEKGYTRKVFDGSAAVNTGTNVITITNHNWQTGVRVFYSDGGGTAITAPGVSTGAFNPATAVNTTSDIITVTAHPFIDGDEVVYSNGGGGDIGGLVNGSTYYILYQGVNTFKLSTSLSGTPIDLTSVGSGSSHQIDGLSLTDGSPIYLIKTGANTLKLAASLPRALAGTELNITAAGSGGSHHFENRAGATASIPVNVAKLNLSTAGNDNTATAGLAARIPGGEPIGIRLNQNLLLSSINSLSATRPSTALEFVGDATIYRVLSFSTAGLVSGQALATLRGSYDFIGMAIYYSSSSTSSPAGYGAVGDDKFALAADLSAVDEERIIGSVFTFLGTTYTVTDYADKATTAAAYAYIEVDPVIVRSSNGFSAGGQPNPPFLRSAAAQGTQGDITVRISTARFSSHDLLDIGTGSYADTNYPGVIYGSPVNPKNPGNEVQEIGKGRVFFTTTDQDGNFRVGDLFRVDQGSGSVTFSASIALSNLDGLGFRRGVPINEFSIDDTLTDNAIDTVPTESAVRGYIDRRLGVTHTGGNTPTADLIPANGGFLPLSGQLAMKGNLSLAGNRIVNVADPISDQDSVNKRFMRLENLQDATLSTNPAANDILIMTGSDSEFKNATVVGDISLNIDSTLHTVDFQINADTILNADINSSAAIAQSKLAMNAAAVRVNATGISQADLGLASFKQSEFESTSGWISLRDNGILITKIEQIGAKTVLGNNGSTSANVSAVAMSSIVDSGGAIKKSTYDGVGVLKRINALSGSSDTDYDVISSVATATASTIVERDINADFAGRHITASAFYTDGRVTLDTAGTATEGYINYYGYLGNAGIQIGDGPAAGDKRSLYDNDLHFFRNRTGGDGTIQVKAITTGAEADTGSITGRWSLVGTSRMEATYADLAEYYESDKEYSVGTVIVFGGNKEITTSNTEEDTRVAGVVSDSAAYIMNKECPGLKILVALQGRVPCKVVGKIRKGDLLVTSNIHGVAVSKNNIKTGALIGKALADYDSDHIGTIEVAVGRT